jgi:hypothetical protein
VNLTPTDHAVLRALDADGPLDAAARRRAGCTPALARRLIHAGLAAYAWRLAGLTPRLLLEITPLGRLAVAAENGVVYEGTLVRG